MNRIVFVFSSFAIGLLFGVGLLASGLANPAKVLAFLARRRSASAPSLRAPGPSAEELNDLLALAARVPDHGKLAPWRFIVLAGEAKAPSPRDWKPWSPAAPTRPS